MAPAVVIRSLRGNAFRQIRYIPGQPVAYVENPKACCTSIKLMLWRHFDPTGAPDNPHCPIPDTPFVRAAEPSSGLLDATFFSVVRNPFSRFLSAYLDKTRPLAWLMTAKSLGFDQENKPSMLAILAALTDRNPAKTNPHFRPQFINLSEGIAPLDFLGHFENMTPVEDFLAKHSLELDRYAPHSVSAAGKIEAQISAREADAIRAYYSRDFALYGYSDDPAILPPVRAPSPLMTNRDALISLLQEQGCDWTL
jgi:hypothetical protein